MEIFRPLRKWFTRRPQSPIQTRIKNLHQKHSVKMQLQQMEDRLAPATLFWQGDDATNPTLWSVAQNWNTQSNGAGLSQAPADTDTLVFNTGTTGFTTFTSSNNIGALSLAGIQIVDASAAGDFIIDVASITLTGNLTSGVTSGTGATINGTTIALGANISVTSTTGLLDINSGIDLNDGTARTLTVNGAGNTNIDGSIVDTGSLMKDGAGTLTLTNANTYGGITTVSQGILEIRNSSALGSTSGGTSVSSGATLQLFSGESAIAVGAEALSLNGSGVGGNGALRNLSGTANSYAGNITLASASEIQTDNRLLVTGNIDNGGSLLTVDGADELQLNGIISGAGGLTKTATGALSLLGANTYDGVTNIIGSCVVAIFNGTALGSTLGGTVVASGATLDLNAAFGAVNVGAEALTVSGGGAFSGGALRSDGAVTNSYAGAITLGGATVIKSYHTGGSTFNLGGTINNAGFLLTLDTQSAAATMSAANTISGAGGITKQGPGSVTFASSNNTYVGATTISDGTLRLSNGSSNNNIASSPTISVGGGTFLNVSGLSGSQLNLASSQTLQGTGTVSGGAINALNGSNVAPGFSPGILNTGSVILQSGSTFTVEVNNSTPGTGHDQLNVTGSVTINGATLSPSGSITTVPGQVIVLIANDSTDAVLGTPGTFNGLPEGATVTIGSVNFRISYAGGVGGNDVTLTEDGPATFTGDATGENFELLRVGDNIQLRRNGVIVDSRPISSVTTYTVNGGDGSDTLTVNYGPPGGFFSTQINFDGDTNTTGPGDALVITGGTFTSVEYDVTGVGAGTLTFAGPATTITFTGLEPVTVTSALGTVTIDIDNAGVDAFPGNIITTIADAVGPNMDVSFNVGAENMTFTTPTVALIVLGDNDGNDIIQVASVDADLPFRAALSIDGQGGIDTIDLNTALTLGNGANTGNLTLAADTINLNAASIVTDAGTAAGNVLITGAVFLGTGVSIDTDGDGADGNVTFSGAGSTVNGGQALTLTAGGGNIGFDGNVGAAGALASITVNSANQLTFAGTVRTTGNILQSAGTALTTFNGTSGTGIGGALSVTTNAITFNTSTVTAVGAVTLNAQNAVTMNTTLNATASTVSVLANQDGTGAEDFFQLASGGLITTTNTTTTAVVISVGGSAGATANAHINNIIAGAGGRVSITTTGGAIIDQSNDTLADIGFAGPTVNVVLSAADGIGSSGNPFDINATNADLVNTTSGGIFLIDVSGGLTLTNLVGTNAVGNGAGGAAFAGGGSFVRANSPLTIAANASTTGDMTYTAADSAGAGDDLTVLNGVTVQDTTGPLTLNAGDNLILNDTSVVTSGGDLNLNVDEGNADVGGGLAFIFGNISAGTVITLTGDSEVDQFIIDNNGGAIDNGGNVDNVLSNLIIGGEGGDDLIQLDDSGDTNGDTVVFSRTASGNGVITGLTDATASTITWFSINNISVQFSSAPSQPGDDVTVTANEGTGFVFDGNDPTGFPGDRLRYDGPTPATKTITGPNSGVITATGVQSVTFTDFERVETLTPPVFGFNDVVNVASLTGGQDGNPNRIRVTLDATSTFLQIFFDGNTTNGTGDEVLISTELLTSVTSLTVNGGTDADLFQIDENAANLLPGEAGGFGGSSATGHTNAAMTASGRGPGNVSIQFDGNAGADSARLNFNSLQDAAYFSDVVGAANSGVVNVAGAFTMSFEDLAPMIFSGAGGALLIDASANTGLTLMTVSDDAGDTAGAGGNQVTGDNAFETAFFAGWTTVTVRSGPGAETINLVGLDAASSETTINLDGDNITNTDAAGDTIRVQSLPATVTANLFGGAGGDLFLVTTASSPFSGGVTGGILGPVNVSPAGDEGGTDTLATDDANGGVGRTVLITSTTIEGITNFAAAPDITYGAGDQVETIDVITSNTAGDTINIQSTRTGSVYNVDTGGGSDTVNISSDAPANAGTLNAIDGQVNFSFGTGTDRLNISDLGDVAGDTYTFTLVGGVTELIFGDGDAAVDIRYNVPFTGGASTLDDLLLVGSNVGNNTYNINNTTGTNTNTVNDGDAAAGAPNDAVFNIIGDGLSANNTFRGFNGNDQFNVTINLNIGQNATTPIASVVIEGNANPVPADSNNRDRTTITDLNSVARNLNYRYLATQGDLDIEAFTTNNGLFGANGGGSLALNLRTMETLIFNGDGSNNDITRVTGTALDDILTVGLLDNDSSATVFLNGNPYLSAPPDTLAGNLPGYAGGGTGVDMLIRGIDNSVGSDGITLDGAGFSAIGNRAVVQATSENDLLIPGGTNDVFGFGVGVLIPGEGPGGAYNVINVNDSGDNRVTTSIVGGPDLVAVTVVPGSFVNSAPTPPRPGLIVNGGDELAAQPSGVADDFFVTPHAQFNIQINGNLPVLAFDGDGLPVGDQLTLDSPTSFSIWSDKQTPPNVSVVAGTNPFGVTHSSIERLLLSPGSGVINLIGDQNNPAIDQNDNFIVVGRNIDSAFDFDAGYQEAFLVINGSAPILVDNIQFLNVYGFDLQGQNLNNPNVNAPDNSVGGAANNIDTLEITAYADNAGGFFGNQPRGWGVHVNFNEGVPAGADGAQADLLIVNTVGTDGVTGLPIPGADPVSENIVIQPSGPEDGEVRVTNAADGSLIVTISYVDNLDIVVNDGDGHVSDTDSLTLRGTNPDGPGASGRDIFDANFTRTGTVGDEFVRVTDGLTPLYNVRSFTNFDTINFAGLGGDDLFRVVGRDDGSLSVNIDGGAPANVDTIFVSGTNAGTDNWSFRPGASSDAGTDRKSVV